MQSKTSLFNKELVIQSFRNVGWIGIIYLVGLFFALPLRVLMEWSNRDQHEGFYYEPFQNVFSVMFPVQLFLLFAVPILLAVFLFRFLQTRSASDFMHSLPVKRTTLYSQYVGIGLLYLIIPIFSTAIALFIVEGVLTGEAFFTVSQILSWAVATTVVTFLVFLTGVFTGMITGLSAVQGMLTVLLLLLPAATIGLIIINLEFFLLGFVPSYYLEYRLIKLSPITNAATHFISSQSLTTLEIFIYLAVAAIFYGLGMWLYKKRDLETVSQAIVFRQLRPVFKYGITFCVMLVSGLYFGATQDSMAWTIFGYVVGSFIGYFIAEMLLRKAWRVFTNLKGYVFYLLAMALLGLIIHFDVTGYQQRIPDVDNIERIYFADSSFGYMEEERPESYAIEQSVDQYKPFFNEAENIQTIRRLHKQIIGNKGMEAKPSRFSQPVFIAYELKDGGKLIRQYELMNIEPYSDHLTSIYNSLEYKEAEYEVINIAPEQVSQIEVLPSGPVNKKATLVEPTVIAKAIAALKEDTLNEEVSIMSKYEERDSDIMISLTDEQYRDIHMPFKQTYTQFENVLKEQGKLADTQVNAEDISYAVVVKRASIDPEQLLQHGPKEDILQRLQEADQALEITNGEQLELAWQQSSWERAESEYLVGFQFKENDFQEIRAFPKEKVPAFIKQHFQ